MWFLMLFCVAADAFVVAVAYAAEGACLALIVQESKARSCVGGEPPVHSGACNVACFLACADRAHRVQTQAVSPTTTNPQTANSRDPTQLYLGTTRQHPGKPYSKPQKQHEIAT